MKALARIGVLVALSGAALFSSCSTSDHYVVSRPVEEVYVRPAAPYANAYWVPGEYVWRGNRYVYTRGYYVRPRANRVYVQGGWVQGPRGYSWRRGHWRR